MRLEEFSKSLLEEMESVNATEDIETIEGAKNISVTMLGLAEKLRIFISEYHFEDTGKELHFFKNIKPKFFITLFYAQKVFAILSSLPVVSDKNVYYEQELLSVQKYLDTNKDLLIYYRSGSVIFDDIYFVRRTPDLWLSLTAGEYVDQTFTTVYDERLAKLLAYEKISVFLSECIHKGSLHRPHETSSIKWTAPKAALIELLYALQTNGSCNNGSIDVKELAGHFENIFNVKLGNFYRTFQEIRIRKISRTTFLDQLKESLIKRMDHSDENPKW